MKIYHNYSELLRSPFLDTQLLKLIRSFKWTWLFVCLIVPETSVYTLSLWIRSHIHSYVPRTILMCLTLFFLESYFLKFNLIWIEGFRFFLLRIPHFLQNINWENRSLSAESFLRRLNFFHQTYRERTFFDNLQYFILICEKAWEKDESIPFSPETRIRIQKICQEFERTQFVLDTEEVTLFLPEMTLRISFDQIQVVPENSLTLVSSEEICPICLEETISIKLNCQHQYCLKCIFKWFAQKYNCPVCRNENLPRF